MAGRQQAARHSGKDLTLSSALAWKCLVKVLLTAHWPEGVTQDPKGMCHPPRHLCLTTLAWGPEGGDTALHRDLREKSPLPWESEGGDSELSWRGGWGETVPPPHTPFQLPWKN